MLSTVAQVKAKPSRKAKVKALYDAQGPEAAFVLGQKLKLKPGSLRTWFSHWHREAKSRKPKTTTVKKAEQVKVAETVT